MDRNKTIARAVAPSGIAGDAAKTALAAGGLLAAFGVASCCALPVALSLLGISAASLAAIGYAAMAYQRELFAVAVICVLGGGVLIWRERRRVACARPVLAWGSAIAFVMAIGLLALTFWIEAPI